jgi:myo-inositol-1-phosphate synthase
LSPDPEKTGLFLVGARGAVATTVLHGLEGLRSGMPPIGMLTESPLFAGVPLVDCARMRVTGWDVAGDAHRSANDLMRTGVLPRDLVEMAGGLRDRLEMSLAPGVPEPEDEGMVDPACRDRLALPPAEMVEALRSDIRGWLSEERTRRGVVVYLASAERARPLPDGWDDENAEPLELLAKAPSDISRSLLYAVAAIAEGVPFVNFTPAPGASAPAIAGWAKRAGVPVLGNDGKTGETLLKTALAPMFRDRCLNVMAWEGYNMLGNRDGAALEEPERKKGKLANKDAVLHRILERSPHLHSGVRIDFVPSLHDWKTAMDYVHFEGFLGARMSLQFTWHGSDSALAAPLVIDLARIALLAADRGEGGPLLAAAPFFKNPLGTGEHDFHRQMDLLRAWVARG